MQTVAQEMNLPATAFLSKHADDFDLRWFTATVELDLCGHETLASAHVFCILVPSWSGALALPSLPCATTSFHLHLSQ